MFTMTGKKDKTLIQKIDSFSQRTSSRYSNSLSLATKH
uniref:Uncharacterized protein n=1 Tax=Rhizophora mucronata TaxID=61149 RepID=A0A2P2PAW1_RHIMU